MALTVTSDADYNIIVDKDVGSNDYFSAATPGPEIARAEEDIDGAGPGWHWIITGTVIIERSGTIVLDNSAVSSPTAFLFTNQAGASPPRIASIESDGVLAVEQRPIRLPIRAYGDLPSSPIEGQVVLEENFGATAIRLVVYLNGGWRYSAYAT